MYNKDFEYSAEGIRCIGRLIYDDSFTEKRPVVLILPAFEGRNQFAIDKALLLVKQGYVAFVVDVYGEGKVGHGIEESRQLMMPVFNDRALLRKRVVAAFNAAKTIAVVDSTKIAAIGFCFGGLCALDLARAGVELKGVVSFHGMFKAPENIPTKKIFARVLLLHGYKDPQVPPEQAAVIAKELDDAHVDWQLFFYGNAMHAFTDPNATEVEMGRKYDSIIAERSWAVMKSFLEEVLSN